MIKVENHRKVHIASRVSGSKRVAINRHDLTCLVNKMYNPYYETSLNKVNSFRMAT